MKRVTSIILLLIIIFLSSCSGQNQGSENLKPENEELGTQLSSNTEVVDDNTSHNTIKQVTVKDLLSEYRDWDGNKDFGKISYILDLDNDTYMLIIWPNSIDNNVINYVEMIYFKSLQDFYSINTTELKHMQELTSLFRIDNEEWMQNAMNEEFPYEKTFKDWKLRVDYLIYNGRKDGVSLRLDNLKQPTRPTTLPANDLNKKRQGFAAKIRGALGPVCDRAYFNSKGELILEVNSEWYTVKEGTKKDIIYSIEKQLKNVKKDLKVEGYGQFFSSTGRPLESFYAD